MRKKVKNFKPSSSLKSSSGKHGTSLKPWYPLLAVAAITLIVYIPAMLNSFVMWDDHVYLWENQYLKHFNLSEVFSFSTFFLGNYHPLTLLWLHLEWLVFPGGDPAIYGGLNPFFFHTHNILLHVLNTLLVFVCIHELVDKKEWKTAAVAALLFGIHPMHVESVAWVSELKDVLYGFFYLAAILAYLRYLRDNRPILLLLTFVLFLFSILAKGQAVTLPVILLLIDYYKGRKNGWKLWFEKVPFLVVSVFFGLLAIRSQIAVNATSSTNVMTFSSLFNASYGIFVYLFKSILPVHLSVEYPYLYKGMDFPFYFYLLPLVIAGILAGLALTLKKTKDWIFGFLFFILTISVMIKLVPVGDSLVNERYSYIPYAGLFFMIGKGFTILSEQKRWKTLTGAVMVVFCLVMIVITEQRIRTWKDTDTLWQDVIRKNPDYWRGYYSLGVQSYNRSDFETAYTYALLACDKQPPAAPYMLRGVLNLNYRHDTASAISDFQKVISFHEKGSPFEREARYNLADICSGKHDYAEATRYLDEAIQIEPGNEQGYIRRGKMFEKMRQYSSAEADFSRAVQMNPNNADAFLQRGMLYSDYLAKYDSSVADFNKVLSLVPGQADAQLGIGFCCYKMNRLNEAVDAYNRILQVRPGEGRVYYFRALAFASMQKYSDAFQDGTKARQLGFMVSDAEMNLWQKNNQGKDPK
jgi:protein O-mannosyl-transferase